MKVPAQIQPYVDALGEHKAIQFLMRFGGAPLYLPNNPTAASQLRDFVSPSEMAALVKALGAGHISRVPVAREWLVNVLFERGMSKLAIARELHITDVTVRRLLKPRDQRQLSFFAEGAD